MTLPMPPSPRRAYECQCGRPVFFRNDVCLHCRTALGYDPERVLLRPLESADEPDSWRAMPVEGDDADVPLDVYRRCANHASAAACNWLVPIGESATQRLCRGCRLVRTVPDSSVPGNDALWAKVEEAKRAVVAQLFALGLPVRSKVSEDIGRGVMFDLLRSPDGGPKVTTGHDDGLVTLDVAEADDAHRESVRAQMHEPYRTLIGHVRHELGHYYWQRLVEHTEWEAPCRELFGDDRIDYGQALERYYAEGAPPDWRDGYVSEYATSHPYEDWAETWAHYLHMVDAFGTARSFGLSPAVAKLEFDPFPAEALVAPEQVLQDADRQFLDMVNGWSELTVAFNQVTRSMGEPDFYPFVLSLRAVRKLHFIHRVVRAQQGHAPPAGNGATA
jgi:hypothetical protein